MPNEDDILSLVGDSNSFIFNDVDNTVLLKQNVMGYCSRSESYDTSKSHHILLYIQGWTKVENLRYKEDHKSQKRDLKMLAEDFE